MKIYADYDDEPQEQFEALPPELYAEMYNLEMGNFVDDLSYYQRLLANNSVILEIGCGTGRLSRLLAKAGHQITGIDLSEAMLIEARTRSSENIRYLTMDMRALKLAEKFDAVIIPYNTLNLLPDEEEILNTLRGCYQHLKGNGQLLLQLYIHNSAADGDDGASFQFQMFDRPQGGKIIKEIIKRYDPKSAVLEMTERYKVRPMQHGQTDINYSHTIKLHCCGEELWRQYLKSTGFSVLSSANSYSLDSPAKPGMLLLACNKTS